MQAGPRPQGRGPVWVIHDMIGGMNNKNFLTATAYCLLPLLLYYVVYEAAVYVLRLCLSYAAQAGGTPAVIWVNEHAGDVSALIGAAAMVLGFAAICKTAAREAPLTRRGYVLRQCGEKGQSSGKCAQAQTDVFKFDQKTGMANTVMQVTGNGVQADSAGSSGRVCPASVAAAILLALSSALFLNLVISMSGASAADAGASSAAAQTAAVSLPLGLLYYGILSPFIEETIFRGITYGRIRTVLRVQSAEGTGKDAAQSALQKRHIIAASVLSSLLFGIYHGNLVQGCYAFCMGLIFCAFLEMMENLAAAALLHGAVNAMTLLLSQSGLYAQLCTPAWLAAFFAIAVCSAICLARQLR